MYFNWSKSSLRYPHRNPITIHHSNLPSNTPQRWTKKCSINAKAGRFSISANLWRVLSWQIMFFIATFARKTLFRLGINSKAPGGSRRGDGRGKAIWIFQAISISIKSHLSHHISVSINVSLKDSRRGQDSTHISIILWLTSVFPLFFPLRVPASHRTAAYLWCFGRSSWRILKILDKLPRLPANCLPKIRKIMLKAFSMHYWWRLVAEL